MRVIKESNVERKVRCENCRSVIAYKAEEVDYRLFPTIDCPVCSKLIKVSIFNKKVRNYEQR